MKTLRVKSHKSVGSCRNRNSARQPTRPLPSHATPNLPIEPHRRHYRALLLPSLPPPAQLLPFAMRSVAMARPDTMASPSPAPPSVSLSQWASTSTRPVMVVAVVRPHSAHEF